MQNEQLGNGLFQDENDLFAPETTESLAGTKEAGDVETQSPEENTPVGNAVSPAAKPAKSKKATKSGKTAVSAKKAKPGNKKAPIAAKKSAAEGKKSAAQAKGVKKSISVTVALPETSVVTEAPAPVASAPAVSSRRGRKPKAEKNALAGVAAVSDTPVETIVAAPKRPGRPKGSKNLHSKATQVAAVKIPAKRGRKPNALLTMETAAPSGTKLADQLGYKVTNAWEDKKLKRKQVFDFSGNYMTFLNKAKTEREFVKEAVLLSEKKGFRNLDAMASDMRLVPGDKIYRVVKNKLIMMAVVGSKPMVEGVRILGAHIDSPRIDIKQNPLYEANDMAFLKTHYYGGIKKYQWTAIPVAIHGVFVKTDGTTVDVLIGEDDKDPIFTITDLLPHLAKDQYDKKLGDAIAGETLNILLGSEPYLGEESKEKVKLNVMRLLSEMYGVKEEDFLSAELEIVPAFKARDLGLDRSMIGAYGHDDKVCAYPAMMAVLESEDPQVTSLCILTDKEEIGSVGNTGAESRAMENFLAELCAMSSVAPYSDLALRKCLDNAKMLSADVTAAVDPNYEGTHDKLNASYLGKGMAIMKYSGARGKSGASDANAEYVAEIRKLLNDNGIAWQTTELGAVDKGGGGTIAMMIANLGVDVIDCGVPVLSMHAPFEVISKVDLFNTYKAYVAFLK